MNLFLSALTILFGGGLVALLSRSSTLATLVGMLSVLVAAPLAGYEALKVLLSGQTLSFHATWSIPGGDFALLLDPLAAFFVLPISLLSFFCALYAWPYMMYDKTSRSLGPHWIYFNTMVAAMLLVVVAANALLFLAAWEIMTLTSFFLVAWDHHHEDVRKAAWLYLFAAHLGMTLLLLMFVLAGRYCGSLNFSNFGPLAQLPLGSASLVFLLALFGFGVKAGLFPVHVWLPDAHPAAPSHVSALMSGILIKTGIYGILRILSLLPPAPVWWGWLMVILGAGGALYGISLATQQRDIKRCLAYSTIENIGIILIGLGFGMVASAQGYPKIALLAFAGGLLHLWNHALFKTVMFLGAGALVHATGTRNMNRMGGLLRRMPLVGLLWIGGSMAISALPPLNGLVSEWLIYLSLAHAGNISGGFAALPPLLLFGLLAMVGALALVTFSRLIGICLLGEPRDPSSVNSCKTAPLMLVSMGSLLAGCLLIGVFPRQAIFVLSTTLSQVARVPVAAELGQVVAPLGHGAVLLMVLLLLLGCFLVWLRRLRPRAQAATWGCGYLLPTARMSYTGAGYAELVSRHLMPEHMRSKISGDRISGIFPVATTLEHSSTDLVLMRILQPLFISLAERCQRLRWLQQGQLSIYLVYIFITSAVLMAWSLWAGGHGGR